MTTIRKHSHTNVRRPDSVRQGDPLSEDERLVLTLVAAGLTNREITARVRPGQVIPEGTVATWLHRSHIKLKALNRTHAVVLALIRGDITLPGLQPAGQNPAPAGDGPVTVTFQVTVPREAIAATVAQLEGTLR